MSGFVITKQRNRSIFTVMSCHHAGRGKPGSVYNLHLQPLVGFFGATCLLIAKKQLHKSYTVGTTQRCVTVYNSPDEIGTRSFFDGDLQTSRAHLFANTTPVRLFCSSRLAANEKPRLDETREHFTRMQLDQVLASTDRNQNRRIDVRPRRLFSRRRAVMSALARGVEPGA